MTRKTKKVYRVTLNGQFGYYQVVSTKTREKVVQEAQQQYPLATIDAELRDITPEEASRITNLSIDPSKSLDDPIFA